MGKIVKLILKIVAVLVALVVTFFAGVFTMGTLHQRHERRDIYPYEASSMLALAQKLRDGQIREAQVSADYMAAVRLARTAWDIPGSEMTKLPLETLAIWQEAKEYYERYDVNDIPQDGTITHVKNKLANVPWSPWYIAKKEFKEKYGGGKLEKAPHFEIKHWFGKPLGASDMAGKVILLDFWNIYCKPCVKSLPKLQATYEQYGPKGLVVIGLTGGPKEKTGEFLKKNGYTFPVGIETWQTYLNFAIEGEPSYFMIDKQGRLAWGPQHDLPDANEIERLLGE